MLINKLMNIPIGYNSFPIIPNINENITDRVNDNIMAIIENMINFLGIITGLVIGLLSQFIVELSSGFVFSYNMFSGYAPIIFTIFGALVGIISSKALRNTVKNYIDVEKLF